MKLLSVFPLVFFLLMAFTGSALPENLKKYTISGKVTDNNDGEYL